MQAKDINERNKRFHLPFPMRKPGKRLRKRYQFILKRKIKELNRSDEQRSKQVGSTGVDVFDLEQKTEQVDETKDDSEQTQSMHLRTIRKPSIRIASAI